MHKRRTLLIIGAILVTLLAGVGGLLIAKFIDESNNPPVANNSSNSDNSSTPPPVKTALSCVEALPASTKIGQKLMVAGYNDQLSTSQAAFIQNNIGGVILMNEASKASIDAFKQGFPITPTIAVDQEGGTVQRYKSEGLLPGADTMASSYTAEQAYQKYLADMQFLRSVGITVNFAPVVDVISANPSPLPGRMYSSDPSVVINYATQFINASKKAAITPVVKHFPGLGSASGNTDNGSATIDAWSVLQAKDIIPYKQLASLKPDAMVSNAIVPGLTDGQPAVWSAAAIAALRSYGYQNSVVYSDSLTAEAIPGSLEDAAIKAWQADIDVALIVQKYNDTATLSSVLQGIQSRAAIALQNNELSNEKISESVLRILQRKGVDPCSL